MFGMPGGIEWIVILIVALLIFGKRLPEVMRSMGKGIVEFKKGVKGVEDDVEEAMDKDPEKLASSDSSKEKVETENKEQSKEMKG
ncbi:MAG: Sec-independent protein translocase subunit TatA/TatB [Candidatus Scalindua sp.]